MHVLGFHTLGTCFAYRSSKLLDRTVQPLQLPVTAYTTEVTDYSTVVTPYKPLHLTVQQSQPTVQLTKGR